MILVLPTALIRPAFAYNNKRIDQTSACEKFAVNYSENILIGDDF
jgi:hypothetical protein